MLILVAAHTAYLSSRYRIPLVASLVKGALTAGFLVLIVARGNSTVVQAVLEYGTGAREANLNMKRIYAY